MSILEEGDFIARFSREPLATAADLPNIIKEYLDEQSNEWSDDEYELLLQALALVTEAQGSNLIPYFRDAPELTGQPKADCERIMDYLKFGSIEFNENRGQSTFSERPEPTCA